VPESRVEEPTFTVYIFLNSWKSGNPGQVAQDLQYSKPTLMPIVSVGVYVYIHDLFLCSHVTYSHVHPSQFPLLIYPAVT